MPSIRIQFPEKDHPQTIVLRGSRITIGRLPSNTIQISDRSVSGRHAELVQEGDHYRVQDAGSTNGTYVNGHRVSDYHLHESCKISFGTLECEFDAVAATESAEGMAILPTQADVEAVHEENKALKNQLDTLKTELEALHQLKPQSGETGALVVSQEEHEKVVAEIASLKEILFQREQEIDKLQKELAVTRSSVAVLEKGLETAQTVATAAPAQTISSTGFSAPLAGVPPKAPQPEPKPAVLTPATPAKPAVAAAPAPAMPTSPKPAPAPAFKPAAPAPAPGLQPKAPAPGMPTAPRPSVPGLAPAPRPSAPGIPATASAAPVQAPPPGAIGGPKPKSPSVPAATPTASVPSAPPPGAKLPGAPTAVPGLKKPVATAAPGIPKPALKPMPVAVAKPPGVAQAAGPGGTQKLTP